MTSLAAASSELFKRYLVIIEQELSSGPLDPFAGDRYLSLENLAWMCAHAIEHAANLPIDKISRWLGCVQGCLGTRGHIDLGVERDISRPLFHAAYRRDGIKIPDSRERNIAY